MSSKKIKIVLSRLEGFRDPDPELEQYMTPAEAASDFLNIVDLKVSEDGGNNIKKAIDLGCGTGMLTIGLGLRGFQALGVEKDPKALEVARENLEKVEEDFGDLPVKFLQRDVMEIQQGAGVAVMNPPFGVQNASERGVNLDFLEKGFEISGEVFALLHRTDKKTKETRQFIKEFGLNQGFEAHHVKAYSFELPNTMDFHKKNRKKISTDLYYFSKR